jgi:hypothetical protein
MPSHWFRPGDPCACSVFLCNPDTQTYDGVPLFVILDVYGAYFFAPSFSPFDHYTINLAPGETELVVLEPFIWPEGAGRGEGIFWYSAMTDPAITELFGEMSSWEFGWGN